jgi:predicted aminopeptidase
MSALTHRLPVALLALAGSLLSGCAQVEYYTQAVGGQFDILERRQPIPEVIEDPTTQPALRERLALVQQVRAFARDALALPDSGSYSSYADLGRPYVVWTVFAAEAFSLDLRQWCYPVVGCAVYRGYFAKPDADGFADSLRAQGYDAYVSGSPAYSTLGWFDDPLLNTVAGWPEPDLAGLIFHELTHERLYVKGDSMFNESLARTVEREGVKRWMATRGAREAYCDYLQRKQRHRQFVALVLQTRDGLRALYESTQSDETRRAGKADLIAQMRARYQSLKVSWGGVGNYDRWFGGPLNNAQLGAVATYEKYVPAFQSLLGRHGGDLSGFFAAVEELGELPSEERVAALQALRPADDQALAGPGSTRCEALEPAGGLVDRMYLEVGRDGARMGYYSPITVRHDGRA